MESLDRVDKVCLALTCHKLYDTIRNNIESRELRCLAPPPFRSDRFRFLSFYSVVPGVLPLDYCKLMGRLALFLPTNDLLSCLKNNPCPWPNRALRDRYEQYISVRRGVLKAKVRMSNFKDEIRRHHRHVLAGRVQKQYVQSNSRKAYSGWVQLVWASYPRINMRPFNEFFTRREYLKMTPVELVRCYVGLYPSKRYRHLRQPHVPLEVQPILLVAKAPATTNGANEQLFENLNTLASETFSQTIIKKWLQSLVKLPGFAVLLGEPWRSRPMGALEAAWEREQALDEDDKEVERIVRSGYVLEELWKSGRLPRWNFAIGYFDVESFSNNCWD